MTAYQDNLLMVLTGMSLPGYYTAISSQEKGPMHNFNLEGQKAGYNNYCTIYLICWLVVHDVILFDFKCTYLGLNKMEVNMMDLYVWWNLTLSGTL